MDDLFIGFDEKNKLNRERALSKAKQKIKENIKDRSFLESLCESLSQNFLKAQNPDLIESLLILTNFLAPFLEDSSEKHSIFGLYTSLLPFIIKYLSHTDTRVRNANAEMIKIFAEKLGIIVFENLKETLLQLIEDNLEQKKVEGDEEHKHSKEEKGGEHKHDHKHSHNKDEKCDHDHQPKPTKIVYNGQKQTNLMHDTEGFGPLVSCLNTIENLISGCTKKSDINSIEYLIRNERIVELFKHCTTHKNRYARESTFLILSQIFSNCSPLFVRDFGHIFSDYMCKGLSDEWPQVRFACCSASRHFMLTIKSLLLDQKKSSQKNIKLQKEENNQKENNNNNDVNNNNNNNNQDSFDYWQCYERFVPPLCFNRYYDAEGVRLFNMETWGKLMETEGRSIVAKLINQVMGYYLERAKSWNENDREAAYHCISELLIKMKKEIMEPFLPSIIESIKEGLKDDVWNVRESCSFCCERFFSTFAQTSKNEYFDVVELLTNLLGDQFPSVRVNAATALGQFLDSSPFSVSLFQTYFSPLLTYLLPMALLQPTYQSSSSSTPLNVHPTSSFRPQVPSGISLNSNFLSSNVNMISSNQSLNLKASFPFSNNTLLKNTLPFSPNLPKKENFFEVLKEMEKLEKKGGIFDKNQKKKRDNDVEIHKNQESFSCCNFEPKKAKKEKEEKDIWEQSDGAVYLLTEISKILPEECVPFLDMLANISSLMHFPLYHVLLQNIWSSLPVLCSNLGDSFGKDKFIELFLPKLIKILEHSDNRHLLTSIYPSFTFFVEKFNLKEDEVDKEKIEQVFSLFEKKNIHQQN